MKEYTITLADHGRPVAFSFEDMIRYHGPSSPGGVAHAFKVLERALPLLGADGLPERREITVGTAFGGPGGREGDRVGHPRGDRGQVRGDPSLALPERGLALERFVFRLGHRDLTVTLILREGHVTEEFIELSRREDRTPEDERRLAGWKLEMVDRVMAASAPEVYGIME